MKEIITTAKLKRSLTERQKNLVEQLPNYNWNYHKAGIAAGYSKSYSKKRIRSVVRKNVELCRLIEDKRLEIAAGSEDKREKAERKLLEIAYDPGTAPATAIKALDTVGKMNAWHVQTVKHETNSRQQELDAAHKQEVNKLLNDEFGVHPMLPAADVSVYDSVGPDADSTSQAGPGQAQNEPEIAPEGETPYPPLAEQVLASPLYRENFLGMNI